VLGATWQVYVHFSKSNSESVKPPIVATRGGIAAGGNITVGGDIITGITLQDYEAGLKHKESEFREKLAKLTDNDTEKRKLLEKRLAFTDEKLANLKASYEEELDKLKEVAKVLEEFRGDFASEEIKEALTSLNKGELNNSEALLQQVVDRGGKNEHVAKAADHLAKLAESRMDVTAVENYRRIAKEFSLRPKAYFFDDFDGNSLGKGWEVINRNEDNFVVENGVLLIISSVVGGLTTDKTENIFRLTNELPAGNWVMTARFRIDFQTAQERPFLGLYQDKNNFIEVRLGAYMKYGVDPFIRTELMKRFKGKNTYFQRDIWEGYSSVFATAMMKELPQPIQLRVTKTGRTYQSSVMIEGLKKPQWIELEKLTILELNGKPILGVYQQKQTSGETIVKVDWLKLETVE
ncbi:hypothetical protein KA005_53685, partial [bacterium]|nr:hypothetical protein [bacterium]